MQLQVGASHELFIAPGTSLRAIPSSIATGDRTRSLSTTYARTCSVSRGLGR